jgi:hypothetical protein
MNGNDNLLPTVDNNPTVMASAVFLEEAFSHTINESTVMPEDTTMQLIKPEHSMRSPIRYFLKPTKDAPEREQLDAPRDTAKLLEWAKKLIQFAQDVLLSLRDEVSAELDIHIATPSRSDLSLQAWRLWQETGAINAMLSQMDFKAQALEAAKDNPTEAK